MPANYTAREEVSTPENEASIFAPTPLWARDAKPRRRMRKTRRVQRSNPPMDAAPEAPAEPLYEPLRVRARPKRHGMLAAVIAAGVAVVAIMAVAGWYVSRGHDEGVALLTPGAPAAAPPVVIKTAIPPNAGQPVAQPADARQAQAPEASKDASSEAAARAEPRHNRRSAQAAASATDTGVDANADEATAETAPASTPGDHETSPGPSPSATPPLVTP